MSEQNVVLHRRLYEATNALDAEALVALCAADVEIQSVFAAVGGAVYQGREGARSWLRDLEDAWEGEFRVEPEAFFELGDRTVALVVLHGRGKQSGVEVAMPACGVAEWRDGLLVSHLAYVHREDAFSDLGTSEDELQRIEA